MTELTPNDRQSDAEVAAALNPEVGAGTPDTAPHEAPPTTAMESQPAAVIGSVVAVIDAVLVAAVPLPEWLTAVLVAAVTVAGAFGIRSKVTPVAQPKLDADTPLTP